MARSVQSIQNAILSNISNNSILAANLTSPSQVALYLLWTFIMATALNEEETINDQFLANSESVISSNPPANTAWITRYVNAFQYSATSPQVGQLDINTLIPGFPTVNTNLQIISRCAIVAPYINSNGVVVGTSGVVLIKVAKGTTPTALNGLELSALQNYLNIIAPGGIIYKALSAGADLLYCNVLIYYNGAYAATIQNDVYTAYINYLSNLPFNGVLKISDLEGVLRNVTGINDIEFININYRQTGVWVGSSGPYNMINNYTQIRKDTNGIGLAGYIIDENTSGFDFLTVNANNFIQA